MWTRGSLLSVLSILTLTADARPPQQVVLTHDEHHHQHHAKIPGFVALGDSYSAGIGTPIPGEKENNCRQGTGAYPFLLASDLLLPNSSITTLSSSDNSSTIPSPFQWLSCTGSLTTDLLTSPSGKPASQIDTFTLTPHPPAFATLSIGGNDLGFFDVLNACIFRFYSFYSGTCEAALAASDAAIRAPDFELRLMLVLREVLDKVRWEVHPEFTITVTGYAQFFDAETEECDDVSLGVWWGGAGVVRGPKLTKKLRRRVNELVKGVNEKVRRVVEGVNGAFAGMERVVFVDFDSAFEGHRFCEKGVQEPDYGREETWFFLPGGVDNGLGGGKGNETEGMLSAEEEMLVEPEKCLSPAERGGDWGERALCYMATAKKRYPEHKLLDPVGENSWRAPTYYGKTFHPVGVPGLARYRNNH